MAMALQTRAIARVRKVPLVRLARLVPLAQWVPKAIPARQACPARPVPKAQMALAVGTKTPTIFWTRAKMPMAMALQTRVIARARKVPLVRLDPKAIPAPPV